MHTIKEIFTIGHGPSSSHTMGPRKAAEMFLDKMPDATNYRVTLYGSLAATGKGHLTDMVIKDVFQGKSYELVWEPNVLFIKKPEKEAWRFFIRNEFLFANYTPGNLSNWYCPKY